MKKEFDWFDKPENIKKLKIACIIILALSIAADFFFHTHAEHIWDGIPGIHALFGFIACAVLIILSKIIGKFWLKKREDYYDK